MKISIQNQNIKVTSADILVSGTVNVYEAEFTFDEAWEGYTPVAVFEGRTSGRSESREAVISGGKATIPWETLLPNGFIRIGVYGVREKQRLPTIYTERLPVQRGAEEVNPAAEPTPGVVDQILINTAADREVAEKAKNDAAASASAASSASGAAAEARKAAQSYRDDAASSAARVQGYINTAATFAQQTERNASMCIDAANAANQSGNDAWFAARAATDAATDAAQSVSASSEAAAYAKNSANRAEQAAADADLARINAEVAQARAETAAINQPYPNAETGTWWVWDVKSGAYKDSGVPASLELDDALTQRGKAADAKAVGDALAEKITAPAASPAATGKILRVLSVNEDGTFTCEWADISEKPFELVENIQLSEDVSSIFRDRYSCGDLYSFRSILIEIVAPANSSWSNAVLKLKCNESTAFCIGGLNSAGYRMYVNILLDARNGVVFAQGEACRNTIENVLTTSKSPISYTVRSGAISSLNIYFGTDNTFPAGTTIKIYGVKK